MSVEAFLASIPPLAVYLKWLSRFSWVALIIAVAVGIGMTLLLKDRTRRLIAQLESEHDWETLRGTH